MTVDIISKLAITNNPTKPIADASQVTGAWMSVATTTARDAIDAAARVAGMRVYTVADQTIWVLGSDLSTWSVENPATGVEVSQQVGLSEETISGLTSATRLRILGQRPFSNLGSGVAGVRLYTSTVRWHTQFSPSVPDRYDITAETWDGIIELLSVQGDAPVEVLINNSLGGTPTIDSSWTSTVIGKHSYRGSTDAIRTPLSITADVTVGSSARRLVDLHITMDATSTANAFDQTAVVALDLVNVELTNLSSAPLINMQSGTLTLSQALVINSGTLLDIASGNVTLLVRTGVAIPSDVLVGQVGSTLTVILEPGASISDTQTGFLGTINKTYRTLSQIQSGGSSIGMEPILNLINCEVIDNPNQNRVDVTPYVSVYSGGSFVGRRLAANFINCGVLENTSQNSVDITPYASVYSYGSSVSVRQSTNFINCSVSDNPGLNSADVTPYASVASAGTIVGVRETTNFINCSVVDDNVNNRVNITPYISVYNGGTIAGVRLSANFINCGVSDNSASNRVDITPYASVASAGTVQGVRRTTNFINCGVSDNSANNRVDVTPYASVASAGTIQGVRQTTNFINCGVSDNSANNRVDITPYASVASAGTVQGVRQTTNFINCGVSDNSANNRVDVTPYISVASSGSVQGIRQTINFNNCTVTDNPANNRVDVSPAVGFSADGVLVALQSGLNFSSNLATTTNNAGQSRIDLTPPSRRYTKTPNVRYDFSIGANSQGSNVDNIAHTGTSATNFTLTRSSGSTFVWLGKPSSILGFGAITAFSQAATSYLSKTGATLDFGSIFSFTGWIRPFGIPTVANQRIFTIRNQAGADAFYVEWTTTRQILAATTTPSAYNATSAQVFYPGDLIFYAAVVNSSNAASNGYPAFSMTSNTQGVFNPTNSPANSTPTWVGSGSLSSAGIWIGQNPTGASNTQFQGTIEDLSFYNRILSPYELLEEYNRGIGLFGNS